MEGLPRQEDGTRFIGTIERFEEGWRASYRLRMPSEVFAQPGQTQRFLLLNFRPRSGFIHKRPRTDSRRLRYSGRASA